MSKPSRPKSQRMLDGMRAIRRAQAIGVLLKPFPKSGVPVQPFQPAATRAKTQQAETTPLSPED